MGYTLGLDIGITSVGFAGISENSIPFSGVHIFDAAENPKNGSSLAAPRREKRGSRRIIHRRALRKSAIRTLLKTHGFQKVDEVIEAPVLQSDKPVWDLRAEALARKLSDEEFIRILFHIGKRRGADYGYNSRGESKKNDTDAEKTKKAAKELEERMINAGFSTIGAYLATQSKKRNGDGSYENFVTRDLLRSEIRKIFDAQRRFGNAKATPELYESYSGNGKIEDKRTLEGEGIAFYQRPLQSSENLIGFCTLEPSEKRAPKSAYTAELFVLWSRLNNCRVRTMGGAERELAIDEKRCLQQKAHALKKMTYEQARKELELGDNDRFNISYLKTKKEEKSWEDIRKVSENKTFLELAGYHELKAALDTGSTDDWQNWLSRDRDKLDEVARILSVYQDDKEIAEKLSGLGIINEQIKKLSEISFSKTLDLSLKAIRNILPLMQEGMAYDKACAQCGYDHTAKIMGAGVKLPPFKDIRNPVVNRALAQTRKVVNAIIRKFGMPETIIVELARDVGKSYEDRREIEKKQQKNLAYKEDAKKHAEEILGQEPNGEELVKYRLWKEQDGCCPYSGTYISPELMRDSAATQIDHILPYSRSWDDSLNNRVLCLTGMNQEKGNRTPFEKWGSTPLWDQIAANAARLPRAKAERMLMQELNEEGFKDRNLNDTRYITREFTKHLEQHLALGKGKRVQSRNGQLTAHLRGVWGFAKKNRENDKHHALDAIVVAASTPSMVQALSNWNRYEARLKHPDEKPRAPLPWATFRDDALASVDKIFVSRLPDRKITGAAHEETIRSVRKSDGVVIQRVKVTALKPAMLENLVDKDRNIKLYNVLKARLDEHGGKPDKAFANPVYMPTNDPEKQGPRINSVRITTSEKSGIAINGGLASNGDMVRVDVFQKDGKFFLVPLYVHHFAAASLPTRAILAYKDEKEWEEMVDSDFIFSLYKNDFVKIKMKKENVEGYYIGTHRGTGSINLRKHDNDTNFGKDGVTSSGVKTALAFEKYSVDYFGNIHRVLKEKRVGLAHGNDPESGEAVSQQGAVAA